MLVYLYPIESSCADSPDATVPSPESWVDLTYQTASPRRSTPLPLGSDDYLRLLREAQRESNTTSTRGSLASSRRDSPKDCIS